MAKAYPRVSIVVPFLNAEKYIEEAIESVFAQTYSSWELLLVDDGSTDGSTQIATRYAEQHSERVHYLEHPYHANLGMSSSRNLGISKSMGEYIARLDADDVYSPNTLEEQVRILDAHSEAGMAYGPARYWFSWTGKPDDIDFMQKPSYSLNTLIEPPTLVSRFLLNGDDELIGMLIRRNVIEHVGGYEEAVPNLYEDVALSAKVCLSYPVFSSEKCWYVYRLHPESFCSYCEENREI